MPYRHNYKTIRNSEQYFELHSVSVSVENSHNTGLKMGAAWASVESIQIELRRTMPNPNQYFCALETVNYVMAISVRKRHRITTVFVTRFHRNFTFFGFKFMCRFILLMYVKLRTKRNENQLAFKYEPSPSSIFILF